MKRFTKAPATVVVLLPALFASSANADDGELLLDVSVAPEFVFSTHPLVGDGEDGALVSPFSPQSTGFAAGRAGAAFRYGIGNSLHLGLGADAAFSAGLVSKDVAVDGFEGELLTGTWLSLAAPLMVDWRFDSGEDASAVLEVSAAPLAVLWAGAALADPNNKDANGLPSRLPPVIADRWSLGGRVEARALFEARLFDVLLLAAGPEVGVAWAETVSVSAGVVLRPSLVVPLPL